MDIELEQLTEAQTARLEEVKAEWAKVSLSCEPCNFEEAKKAVIAAYKEVGLTPPVVWIRTQSPIACATVAAVLEEEWKTEKDPVKLLLKGEKKLAIRRISEDSWEQIQGIPVSKKKPSKEAISVQLNAQIYGSHESSWLAFYAAFLEFGVKECERLIPLMDLAKHCGWWAPYSHVCILEDRHTEIHLDEDGNLHNDEGPAVAYADGVKGWVIHNVPVTEQIVLSPETLTIKQIRNEQNAEVRRIMRERFGMGRYLAETHAKVIDADFECARKGAAPRVLLEEDDGERWLVGTDGSTKRVYYMSVPRTVKTCREGHEFISGLNESLILNKS